MWFMPTMGRPERCQEVLHSIINCGVSTPGIVIVNGGERQHEYLKLDLPDHWRIVQFAQNYGIGGALNLAFEALPDEPWYGMVCDDEHVFTPQFDVRLVEAAGGWNIANGNDGWQGERRIHTYVVIGGHLLRACGWWTLAGLWHFHCESVWELIAAEFGLRRYCADVRTEHRHHEAGLAADDATYQNGRSRAMQDEARFEQWKQEGWPVLRDKLRLAIPPEVDG